MVTTSFSAAFLVGITMIVCCVIFIDDKQNTGQNSFGNQTLLHNSSHFRSTAHHRTFPAEEMRREENVHKHTQKKEYNNLLVSAA